jgi:hypothetical protein
MGGLMRRDQLDVFWACNILLPRLRRNVRKVLTVYDLCHRVMPENMSFKWALAMKLLFEPSIARADAIVAISQGTADRLNAIHGCRVGRYAWNLGNFSAAPAGRDRKLPRTVWAFSALYLVRGYLGAAQES